MADWGVILGFLAAGVLLGGVYVWASLAFERAADEHATSFDRRWP